MARFAWALLCSFAVTAAFCAQVSGGATTPSPAPQSAATAPATPPSTPVDCTTVVYGMMDCLDYVSSGSNQTKPTQACCNGVQSVVQVSPICLCEAVKEGDAMNLGLNMTRTIDLPATCKISIPDLHNCTDTPPPSPSPVPPATAPATSPAGLSPPQATAPTSEAWAPGPSASGALSHRIAYASAAIAMAAATFFHF
ncbi:unnamed protein product [Spirodela intermedia]|uniref:Bifunctional inhibitor/plant lipid transfer protein/seed storage helical domain-containing protein n=1 Tax=Spirodela intermedia TaxID=51605 RepID=A0A7I8KXK5_SPIIN|nr:unnamed protein product [Spirodela intermedia]